MNELTIKEHIKELKKSIIYLDKINHKGAVIMAKDDLKHFQLLLSGYD